MLYEPICHLSPKVRLGKAFQKNWYLYPPLSRYDPRPTSRRNKLLPVIIDKGIASIVPWYTGRPTKLYNGAIGISGTAAKN